VATKRPKKIAPRGKNPNDALAEELVSNYHEVRIWPPGQCELPSQEELVRLFEDMRNLLYPGLTGQPVPGTAQAVRRKLDQIERRLVHQIELGLCHRRQMAAADAPCTSAPDARALARGLLERLPELRRQLATDVLAAVTGDPAASGADEVIFCYPGLYAITAYRLAHVMVQAEIPVLPRMLTEHAHARTGIDIHPGADIGESFFIDHGTGVVIGETTVIGRHVRIYQGVTLGALSVPEGQTLRGKKRHPTLEDDVVIYANATILGGDTVIGRGAIIGGNTWVTQSVPPGARIIKAA
jgi:serine O-acetyltransferase